MTTGTDTWKRCSVCKTDLGFEQPYYECSVSTCTSGRNHSVFCSVTCWEQHVPVMRHREAWADEKKSPSRAAWSAAQAAEGGRTGETAASPRRIVVDARSAPRAPSPAQEAGDEVLVIASRLKAYIRARSGMNTSESVLDELSQIVREAADRAIEQARADGRKTVMDRDFKKE
jgi:histone H3/H4